MRNLSQILWMTTAVLILSACNSKQDNKSFVFVSEEPPSAPVIISPTSAPSYTSHSSAVHIVGCYRPSCKSNVGNWSVQASGAGTLITSNTTFTFDANMLAGEVRVFSFTFTNQNGQVSPATTLTITYDATVDLSPLATLFHGGASTSGAITSANGAYVLNFLTTLPSLPNVNLTSGGYVLTSGALNPQ